MNKKFNITGATILILALSILVMSVGFAISSEKLTINGSSLIQASGRWDIHFANIIVNKDSVEIENVKTPATINRDSMFIDYDVILNKYGDFYEFTVDVVNSGNIDAKINSVLCLQPQGSEEYLQYTAEYLDGTKVLAGDELLKNSRKTIKVRVQHINPNFVEESVKFNMSFALEFVQK